MKKNLKIIKIIMCGLSMAIAFSLCSCKNSEKTTGKKEQVVVGTQTLANPESIVKAENWLEEKLGVAVSIVNFDGGRDVNTAMASGDIDFGMLGSVPAALAISNNVNCQVICIQSVLGDIESLVVNKDSNIKKAEDLKNKTIATVFSSTSHYSFLKYLEVNNIDAKEVNIIDMNASDILAAFERGDIDGAFVWEPQVSEMLKKNGETLTSAGEMADLGYATMDVEIVNKDFAEKNPEIVEKYISCIDEAVKMYREDKTRAGQSMSKDLGISVDDCLSQIESSIWLSIEEQVDGEWFKNGKLAENLYDTANFLFEQGDLSEKPNKSKFDEAVTDKYMQNLK